MQAKHAYAGLRPPVYATCPYKDPNTKYKHRGLKRGSCVFHSFEDQDEIPSLVFATSLYVQPGRAISKFWVCPKMVMFQGFHPIIIPWWTTTHHYSPPFTIKRPLLTTIKSQIPQVAHNLIGVITSGKLTNNYVKS